MKDVISDIEILDDNPSKEELVESSVSDKKVYIESYGCQMNFSDSEIIASILKKAGYSTTNSSQNADLILLNTCSIRDKAEQTIRKRLKQVNSYKATNPDLTVGILGCMAERLKSKLLEEERIVDLVAGPDAYRNLPHLLDEVDNGNRSINTFLSKEETYGDINPTRFNTNGVTAFISIMRGCDNICSFCVVPFTRGKERSRDPYSIVKEAKDLFQKGYREVTLLGQNVDSYKWSPSENNKARLEKSDHVSDIVNFAGLLQMVANVDPSLRVRFSTSHPKDITNEVLYTMRKFNNICKYIHLPVQSGNTRILKLMNRTYTRDWYINRVDAIREILGVECGISSDMISGFCTETEDEHKDTLSLMDYVRYDFSYMFFYSERPGTLAARKLKDDIPINIKKKRLSEIIDKQRSISLERHQNDIGRTFNVLIEGRSKRSDEYLQGRNSANKVIIFKDVGLKKGEFVNVKVHDCTPATLLGDII